MRQAAVNRIVQFIREHLDQCPIREQIEVYDALSHVLPTSEEREAAIRIATTLAEAEALQTDFTRQLFKEIQWPGHQHDGAGQKGGQS